VVRVLGYAPEQLLARPFFTLALPDDQARLRDSGLKTMRARGSFRDEVNARLHRDGKTVWVLSRGTPTLDPDGSLLGYRGIDVDVSEQVRLQEEPRQSQKLEAVGTLAGGMAHALNGQLKVVAGCAELLRMVAMPLAAGAPLGGRGGLR
jgi:PAS domain S-box-containing protein